MNTAENRLAYISEELHRHWINEVQIPVMVVEIEGWSGDPESLGPCARCGWAWPLYDDDDDLVVIICPALIAVVTAHLTDEHLADYLGIVEFVTDKLIVMTRETPDLDPWDQHQQVLDILDRDHPGALRLLQEVQIKANS